MTDMETLERTLKEHPFFADMDSELVGFLVGCTSNAVFKSGDFLFREGEEADQFYVIRHGTVMIETNIGHVDRVRIETLREGDIIGWSWMVRPYRWHFDARAVEPTRAFVLDGKCLREKFEEDHHLGYELMKRFVPVIVERLEATRRQLMDIFGKGD
jgi:CRP-like cAMP-binding protein